ncbi:MAG TPA: ATP-binding protein [Chryseosolibacter sp.]
MTFLRKLAFTGVHFAHRPFQRRSILLSNIVSLIIFCLGTVLFFAYNAWYGWGIVTWAILGASLLCLTTIVLNYFNLSIISRIFLTLLIPVIAMSISIYAKIIYYDNQEELDYFTFRFIILAACVFPCIFFSFKERTLLFSTCFLTFFILMGHDPLHDFYGVPYRQHVLKETNYAFTNVVILITYGILMGAVMFLKWISEESEERAARLIQELNQTNEDLLEKNTEIESQNAEILAQAENLNQSQTKLQEAYEVIEEQKNLLVHQNINLSTELVDINKDLTETNSELIKHNNELRQFSYTVSHNLRGPVASLMGLINIVDTRNFNEDNKEIHEHIKTSVKRLDNIITDLSQIIDIRHDIFHIRQKINLEAEVREIVKGFKKDLETHDVQIKTNFTRCPEIYSVRPMVHSILYNLISNAIKYRAHTRRPEIEISSDVGKNYVIVVTDNGLGIDLKAHQQSLFKLYKRFHYHTEGKGLGLYLVKLQAEALGGHVEVTSEMNKCTTFKVNLDQPANVERQILYQEAHARIFFDAKINSTGVIWKGPVSSNQYRSAFKKCLEFVKVYSTPNYIADLSEQGYISREDQLWMFHDIMPEAAQYGLRRIAAVKPGVPDENAREYMKGITETLKKLGIVQEYFPTFDEAVSWIQYENEKASAGANA